MENLFRWSNGKLDITNSVAAMLAPGKSKTVDEIFFCLDETNSLLAYEDTELVYVQAVLSCSEDVCKESLFVGSSSQLLKASGGGYRTRPGFNGLVNQTSFLRKEV